jgi:branched-subunit amino acid ABC-type transport system permease component
MNMAQVLVSGLISAAELGIVAIGLTMTFSILRFANFSHASMAVVGAYLGYFLNVTLGAPLLLAFAVAALAMGLFGVAVDAAIFRIMRNTGDLTPMIGSLGLSIVIQYSVQAIWGPQFLRYHYSVRPGLSLLGARITAPQIGIILVAAVALFGFHALLKFTALGKAMRATATNPELAQACSIDVNTVIRAVWFIGTAFAALGGMFIAWDTQLDPYFGFNLIIPVFCVVLIGGVGSFYGAIAGALIIGLAENIAVNLNLAPLLAPLGIVDAGDDLSLSSSYKPAVAYALVVLLLLLRPSGMAQRELI